jgi:hypothetical protein
MMLKMEEKRRRLILSFQEIANQLGRNKTTIKCLVVSVPYHGGGRRK